MKKNIRRLLAVCLVAVLVLSMSVTALAFDASTVFTYGDATYYATLTKASSRSDVYKKLSGGGTAEHISGGQDTPIYGSSGSFTMTYTASMPSGFYKTALRNLLPDAGLRETCTASGNPFGSWIYVDPALPSGTYQWAVRFNAYDADWEVGGGGSANIYFGTISKAPTGTWAYDVIRVG